LRYCGYHITDSFFFFFFFLALIYYSRKETYEKYLFYIFLGLSICVKYYTLPVIILFILKYLYEKDWKELIISTGIIIPLLIIFIIIPFFYLDWYREELLGWSDYGSYLPLYIRLIPIMSIIILFTLFRLRKCDQFEMLIVSMIAMGSFLFFSFNYLRWFQSIIFYGILKEKEFLKFNLNLGFIKREIKVNNHLLTFYLSFIGVLSYPFILFALQFYF